MIIKKGECILEKELYVSFEDGLMPIAGQYRLSSSSTNIEMNSPILIIIKVWDDEQLFSKSEIISIEFIYDHELGKYLHSKVKRNYNLDYSNNNHLSTFLNYLNTSFGVDEDEMWRELKKTILIDENELLEFYKEDNKTKQTLRELMKNYTFNVIHRYL